jgi:hypothetical protein
MKQQIDSLESSFTCKIDIGRISDGDSQLKSCRPALHLVGGLTSGKEEKKDTTTYAGRIYSTGTCLSYAVCRRAQLELASACRRWNWTSRPCHACISHRHHSCMHVPRGWIWTILVRDENGRKRYLFGNQFFGRFSLITNK